LQHWLQERASMLRLYLHRLSFYILTLFFGWSKPDDGPLLPAKFCVKSQHTRWRKSINLMSSGVVQHLYNSIEKKIKINDDLSISRPYIYRYNLRGNGVALCKVGSSCWRSGDTCFLHLQGKVIPTVPLPIVTVLCSMGRVATSDIRTKENLQTNSCTRISFAREPNVV
jgi:hypothetical protein